MNIKAPRPTSTLFYRQQHNTFTATTTLYYVPRSSSDLAGLTCYQSEAFNYVFGITKCGDQTAIVLQRTARGKSETVASATVGDRLPVGLRVSAEGDKYTFSYAERGGEYKDLATVSGDILSTNVAGGFTGAMIGLYATAANDATCK